MCCTRADGGVLGSSLVSAVFILGVLWRGVVGCSACGGQGPGFESRQCSVHTRRVVARRGRVQRVLRPGSGVRISSVQCSYSACCGAAWWGAARAEARVRGSNLVRAAFVLAVLWRGVVGCSACGGQGPGFEPRQCKVRARCGAVWTHAIINFITIAVVWTYQYSLLSRSRRLRTVV